MTYLIGLFFIALIVVYYSIVKTKDCNSTDANIIEDIPTISVNEEDLRKHAADIAKHYSYIKNTTCRKKVIKSLDESFRKIIKSYYYMENQLKGNAEISPASEWLLDNIYLIEKEYKHIKYNMPISYYKNLPVIDRGSLKGYPRIYHISAELVSHTEGKLNEDTIEKFVNAYQSEAVLTSGELWALPIMIRISLIQNIGKITENIVFSSNEKRRADEISDQLLYAHDHKNIENLIEELINKEIKFTPYFTERLLKVLRDNSVDSEILYQWIDNKLELEETNTEKMINLEHQMQATDQTSIGNSINSIRDIEAMNWKQSFEKLSYVENILIQDPAGIYSKMDFESRDYYRHKVEKLSTIMKKPESFIAKKSIQCATEVQVNQDRLYEKHVGYYLIDNGVNTLKEKLDFKSKGIDALKNHLRKNAVKYYIGTILFGTFLFISLFLYASYTNDTERVLWRYILAIFVLIVPCSEIIVSFVNWNITNLSNPSFIPKMDLKEGVGEGNRTVVVIPTIINDVKRVKELVERLEVFYLANYDHNIYFALLSDLRDSNVVEEPGDCDINLKALELIHELNEKYCKDQNQFYYMCRDRKYNEKENLWMGWERKRGKLMEFICLLRNDKETSYHVISGDIQELSKAKYIITLDADTQLTRDSGKKLIGAMSHILNEPSIDNISKRVTRGYGVMQPRVGISILSSNKTMYSKIFSGETGIDTYSTAVSDIYQDLFGEGIFVGKGILNIDAFYSLLKDEIPENSILSHDLLEGVYVRAALVSDIEVIDGYPAYFISSSKRLHRWVRGDWQLLPWIYRNKVISWLSKWKMIDNLRRSLLSPFIILLMGLSFQILPDGTDKWIVAGLLALISPILFNVTENLTSPVRGISLSGKVNSAKDVVKQVFLICVFLPYSAYSMLDAAIRTLYRVYISKKNLLEWQTAADIETKSGKELKDYVKFMWIGSVISGVILLLAFLKSFESGILMTPICVVWIISPWIAWYISKDTKKSEVELTVEQIKFLRKIARKTWAYFDDFVDEENHWLAPDNFQEEPPNGVAHRTSPTNIGMGLTSNVVAYDLGYIGLMENVKRIANVLRSIEDLQGYNGHLFNWYNTKTMEPLYPKYVSTVDSGNLAGYLWVIQEALREYFKYPFINRKILQGIKDTLSLANDEVNEQEKAKGYYEEDIIIIEDLSYDLLEWKCFLLNLLSKSRNLKEQNTDAELYWNRKLEISVDRIWKEISEMFPFTGNLENDRSENIKLYESLNDLAFNVSVVDIETRVNEISRNYKNIDLCLESFLQGTKTEVKKLGQKMNHLIYMSNKMVEDMDFNMLYDKKRGLFSIGYDVESDSLGRSYYDLLASEARQASFIAIAKGDIDTEHWFKLGRSMAVIGRTRGLVSWSGTMFEYLMPFLIMKSYPSTLLSQTYSAIVDGQKKYAKMRRIPWGISESAYRAFDISSNYQYKAFGVPGIGLKRGLKNDLVVSPYSTVMALQVDLKNSIQNMMNLRDEGLEGKYGFYEAIDYTPDRMTKGEKSAIIKCFMVHHQGMSLMALDNILNDSILRKRFHNSPHVKASELLLQEKISNRIVYERQQKFEAPQSKAEIRNNIVRKYNTAKTDIPEIQLLSNGTYSMMISNSGGGYGKQDDMSIYRWKEDVTTDNSGLFFYIKDVMNHKYWSTTYEPCKSEGQDYEVIFSEDKADFKRRDHNIITHMEVAVSSEDDAEVRRISLTNNSNETKILEITSYCEVTLAHANADMVHPAFSNLFIRTEYLSEPECIIANRRPRAKGQKVPYIVQCMAIHGSVVGTLEFETSRVNFIGRDKNTSKPNVIEKDIPLKNTVGAVLDPIISMRRRVKIVPGETCKIAFTTAVTDSRDHAIAIAKKYRDMISIDRAYELTCSQSIVEMKYLGIKSPQANLYQTMASRILFLSDLYKDREDYIKSVVRSQKDLWKYGISGDNAIVLVIVKEESHKDFVRQMLTAHEYWCLKGLRVDLIVLNLQNTAYTQPLQEALRDVIVSSHARDKQDKSGGVFLHNGATIEREDINLLMAISRIVVEGDKGLILNQIRRKDNRKVWSKMPLEQRREVEYKSHKYKIDKLEYYNDIGGFDLENEQYVICLKEDRTTPAPWVNVIANEDFGFVVSETGSPYTWYKNSRENKLTTWSNDWVSDPTSEALYIRDEDSGKLWSICPKPIRDSGEYIIEHGYGYSNFKHDAFGILGEVMMFVPRKDPIKICRVKLNNNTKKDRKLSLTYYAQMVLGVVPQHTSIHIATQLNKEKKYMSAQNPYSDHFGKIHAYLKIIGGTEESFTGNRTEFIGRGGSLEYPSALENVELSNLSGAGCDPCLAENVKITLEPGEEKTLLIILGASDSLEEVEEIIKKYNDIQIADTELESVKQYWSELLHTIQVKTPDKSMDIMLNGWLLYQTISCRIWARSGFYQSGGAFGFRDQLQDVMAAGYVDTAIMKEHILYSASRQFTDGDVQHWWHPIVDSGIRTRFSDDLLWLPYVTIDYLKRTGDYSILDEKVGYLEDTPLEEGEDERYTISKKSDKVSSLYEHCIRAIERGLKFGSHNIPLMGSGDWNDGMSEVGNKGKGESVWLGWFLYSILDNFMDICAVKNDQEKNQRYEKMKEFIKENLNKNAWDGNWYRRAYFDDGTPLGSLENDECQIDSLSQSWAVISKAGDPSYVKIAMSSLEKYLVKEDTGMVLLLTPPFENSKLEPGYIKGYVPGVRENGGQYTHASTWVVLAMAMLGEGDKASKIFHMLNPINHTKSYYDCEKYKVEPYVITADVYGREPHIGRGGWSWYTGAAGWMYRVAIEGILGLTFEGAKGFTINPSMPEAWDEFEINYKKGECKYFIKVRKGEKKELTVDGVLQDGKIIPYLENGDHEVILILER